ncbi:hypothetical protein [uncultured Roseobacter sp.]|uniref:hypothetical protein n=1 Tax=uncultured Roseobacter sp. TaxID=114847 RepID=UPI0026186E8B|nr:hypothetical protein [uncultured Roseobacter sp.]
MPTIDGLDLPVADFSALFIGSARLAAALLEVERRSGFSSMIEDDILQARSMRPSCLRNSRTGGRAASR